MAKLSTDIVKLADELHSAAIHLLRQLRVEDRAAGIGPAQLSALSVLVFGGTMSLKRLAAIEQVKPPTMVRIVRGLIELHFYYPVAGITLDVLDIPGHSPGHVVYLLRGEPCLVFGGDVLFRGSVGRTDFPGGSADRLFAGIRSKLFTLPDDTVVYPGHGPVTQTGFEKRTNPFVGGETLSS